MAALGHAVAARARGAAAWCAGGVAKHCRWAKLERRLGRALRDELPQLREEAASSGSGPQGAGEPESAKLLPEAIKAFEREAGAEAAARVAAVPRSLDLLWLSGKDIGGQLLEV